ncbi:acyl carrier protein [Marinobacter sp. M3C]|jgi:acyl carrier protein|uniref:acyl carrier protein n=1 Tax=Marinobacter sp. M3C TaxID=2917715 RepID=UPI00200F6801|nr:acyl carrier protein [Marinobacter sp. M3C]MCL1476709.1 acyl carrier protein [Marinobacter sp.]UQG58678.1 acyl carrier protein [Marinobacter sp. M3C]
MLNAIHKICAEVLDYPDLKVDEDFFDVGGHSLMMAEIQRQLHENLKVHINMEALFRNPTVINLSKAIHLTLTEQAG